MKKLRSTLLAAGAAAGMTLAGLGVANAQTSDAPPQDQPANESVERAPERSGHRGVGGRHHGKGMGIHGEFVTRAPEGGFQTVATQVGVVTASSPTSLTVRSEDNFTRTYVINDETRVSSQNNGIADVANGDTVHVRALVDGDTATATDVREARPKPAPEADAA
jgi:hypothetical protein